MGIPETVPSCWETLIPKCAGLQRPPAKLEPFEILCVYILGLFKDNGKENGNYYNGLYRYCRGYIGLCRDNGKENGNYYIIIGIMEEKMETTI